LYYNLKTFASVFYFYDDKIFKILLLSFLKNTFLQTQNNINIKLFYNYILQKNHFILLENLIFSVVKMFDLHFKKKKIQFDYTKK